MAKQNKGRKLFATTATAALVASAIVPVASAAEVKDFDQVPAWAKDAVKYLVDNGSVQGDENGKFNPTNNLTRAQAAEILKKELKLEATGTEDYSDVASNNWFYDAVLATSPEIFEGNDKGQFLPNKELTRQEAAKVLVEAYGLTGSASLSSFTDASTVPGWSKSYLETAVSNGVMKGQGTKLAPTANITNAEFATMVYRAIEASTLSVTAVSAVNENTLELTGTGLQKLKAEDITLSGNIVKSVTGNGSKATVVFENNFPVDSEQTVKVKVGEDTKEFKFTYGVNLKSVELKDQAYDDDTAGQVLAFTINGSSVNTNTEFLRQAGYTVKFVADTAIFAGASKTSATGVLDTDLTTGNYTVQIQISKGGVVVVSDTATITIADIEGSVSAITFANFANSLGFDHNSTTLVTGETATVDYVEGNAVGKTEVELNVAGATVTSSNPAVISVAGKTLSANAPGTATITVKIGSATKTYNFTVTNTARKLAKATPSETTVKLVDDATDDARTIQITTLDQYGDPIAVDSSAVTPLVKLDLPKDNLTNNLVSVNGGSAGHLVTGTNGKTTSGFVITPAAVGNGTILIKDANNTTIGQIAVQVNNVDNVDASKQKIEYTYDSRTTNSFKVGQVAKYQVSNFSTAGHFNGVVTLNTSGVAAGQYFVESANTNIATVAVASNVLTVTGVKPGTTTITFKDADGIVKHQFNVTISSTPTVITKVNFKANTTVNFAGKKVDVADVLDVRADAGKDSIVYGVEHNGATAAKVRLDVTSTNQLILYIDNNGDGDLNASPNDDTILGAVTAEVLTGSTTATAGTPISAITDITVGGANYTTASKDKGTILFRVIVDANGDGTYAKSEAISTTVLNVEVK